MEQRPHVAGAEYEPGPGRREETQGVAVGHQDTLRPPRRAGGVDHVRQVVGRDRHGGRPGSLQGDRLPVGVESDDGQQARVVARRNRLRKRASEVAVRQQHARWRSRQRVRQHEGQTLARIARIQGHVGAAGLENAEQPQHHVERPLDADRHRHVRPDAEPEQVAGEPVGSRRELAVGERPVVTGDGGRMGGEGRSGGEEMVEASLHRESEPGAAPLAEQLVALGRGEGWQGLDLAVGQGEHAEEQALQVGQQPAGERAFEAAWIPEQPEAEMGSGSTRHAGERIIGLLDHLDLAHLQAAARLPPDRLVHRVVLERQDAREERLAARHLAPALHAVERGVFELAHLGLPLLQLAQPVEETGPGRDLHARRQRIDEQPDDRFDPRQAGRAPGADDAEDHVLLAAEPREQQGPGSLH